MFFIYPQVLCATGLLTIMHVGLMDSPTPLSVCLVRGIYLGTIKVRDMWVSRCYTDAE